MDMFNQKRTTRLQEDPDIAPTDGDVLALDDTHSPQPYAKGIPFLYWFYDSSTKVYMGDEHRGIKHRPQ